MPPDPRCPGCGKVPYVCVCPHEPPMTQKMRLTREQIETFRDEWIDFGCLIRETDDAMVLALCDLAIAGLEARQRQERIKKAMGTYKASSPTFPGMYV